MELMATEVYVQHQYSLILGYIFLIKRKTKLHSHPQWLEGELLKAIQREATHMEHYEKFEDVVWKPEGWFGEALFNWRRLGRN